MAYYNNKRIFPKIVINGVPHYFKVMLTLGDDDVEEILKNHTLYLTGENVAVTNDVLNITDNQISVSNGVLIL